MSKEIPIIYVGKKPLGNYLFACRKASEKSNTIKIVARGILTSKAVAIAEIFRSKIPNTIVKVEISSEEVENMQHRMILLTSISITITIPTTIV